MNKLEKYCPYCKENHEVESLGILPIGLVDGSSIYVYRCKECRRIFRVREKDIKK